MRELPDLGLMFAGVFAVGLALQLLRLGVKLIGEMLRHG